jgi:hypothetical protein
MALNPFKSIFNIYKKVFESGRDKESEQLIRQFRKDKIQQLKDLRENRGHVDSMTYEEMLSTWGVENHQVNNVCRGLLVEVISVNVVMLLSVFAWIQFNGLFYGVSSLCLLAISVMATSSRLWRRSCLRQQQFTPFKKWVMNGFYHGD